MSGRRRRREGTRCLRSGAPQIVRHLPAEFREEARDLRHVELVEDRFLRLAVEQEAERRFDATLGSMAPAVRRVQVSADIVTSWLVSPDPSRTDDMELQRIAFADPRNLDHRAIAPPPILAVLTSRLLKTYSRFWHSMILSAWNRVEDRDARHG